MRVLVEEPLSERQEDSHEGQSWTHFRRWTCVAAVIMLVRALGRKEFVQELHVASDLAQCQTEPIGKKLSSTFRKFSFWDIPVMGEQEPAPSEASLEAPRYDNKRSSLRVAEDIKS